MRQPEEITHNGKTLREILDLHGMWSRGETGGQCANLSYADLIGSDLSNADLSDAILIGANLWGASLRGAYLSSAIIWGTTGNMREIRSMQVDKWPVAWITAPNGEVTLQIGCQRHPLEMWRKAEPRWIAAMDTEAPEWWAKHRDLVLGMVDACPATPYGQEREE